MKKWYEIKAMAANGKPAAEGEPVAQYVISIHGDIGDWGVTASDFIAAFNAIPADAKIILSVHSDGGEVFESFAIYHVLARARDRITARVEGIAASAASMVIMAAGTIEMPANAYLMIHNPFVWAAGDYAELRATADLMEKLKDSYVSIYAERSGKTPAEIEAIMAAETWLNGTDAVAAGFADTVLPALPAMAHLSERARARFAKAPQALAGGDPAPAPAPEPAPTPTPAPTPEPAPNPEPTPNPSPDPAPAPPAADPMPADEVATACVNAGMAPLAAALIRAKAGREAVAKRLDEAREITALAQAAGRPADAGDLILAGVSVDVARATLTAARAQGAPTINPHAPADNPPRTQDDPKAELGKRLDFTTIYARRQAVGKAA